MFEYRVTKYNPAVRSEGRQYNEWTSISHVGTAFDGQVLTQSAYEEVEAAYVAVATAFLREAEADSVSIRGLEDHKDNGASYAEGDTFAPSDAGEIMAQVLREEFWCRLEGDRGVRALWIRLLHVRRSRNALSAGTAVSCAAWLVR